jgi:hypothetical protein
MEGGGGVSEPRSNSSEHLSLSLKIFEHAKDVREREKR